MRCFITLVLFSLLLPLSPAHARGWHSHGGGYRRQSAFSHRSFTHNAFAHTAAHGFASGMGHAAGAALGRHLFSGHHQHYGSSYDNRYAADDYTTTAAPGTAAAPDTGSAALQPAPEPVASPVSSANTQSDNNIGWGPFLMAGALIIGWKLFRQSRQQARANKFVRQQAHEAQVQHQVYERMSGAVLSEQEMRRYSQH